MSYIPNTKYISITKDGLFVGGKTATHYCGYPIKLTEETQNYFILAQQSNPNMKELHVGAFDTVGEFAIPGTPSGKDGINIWARIKMNNGRLGNWVFSDVTPVTLCAFRCIYDFYLYDKFRSAVNKEKTPQLQR